MISHKKFNTVTHLGQITNFDTLGGNPGQMQVKKKLKTAKLAKKSHKTENFHKKMDIIS